MVDNKNGGYLLSSKIKQPGNLPPARSDDGWFDDQEDWNVPGALNERSEEEPPCHEAEAISHEATVSRLPDDCIGFKSFYIAVEEESDLRDLYSKRKVSSSTSSVQVTENNSDEGYEKSFLPRTKDHVSSRFWKKLNKVPGQIVRYHLNDSSLLNRTIADLDKLIELCSACSSKSIFKLQLACKLSAFIFILQPRKSDITSPEFATVLIYTCSRDCSIAKYFSNKLLF